MKKVPISAHMACEDIGAFHFIQNQHYNLTLCAINWVP